MRKFLQHVLVLMVMIVMPWTVYADDYQLPDPHFEDWSGSAFDGKEQPKYWHASNVEQSAIGLTFRFNFANKETGRTGYCLMVQDMEVGAANITETSPAYFSLGTAWQYLESLNTGTATAGTYGGYAFTHRPDSVSVWIKRLGDNTDKEDFHILYYSWSGTAQGSSYKNKNEGCTSTDRTDEESDIRIALDGNECRTTAAGGQVAEGWWRERKTYGAWTNIRVPIYYMNDNAPKKCNMLFSASNYPNFRANDGLYVGNSLYVDDVELIYSSKIDKLEVGDKVWKGFDPNSTDVQVYSLGETATELPDVTAYRGVGTLTNARGKTVTFPGRKLSGSEITVVKGNLENVPTTITVRSEDGKSTTVYRIQFQRAASTNAKLAGISYVYGTDTTAIPGFSASKYNYNVELPYGSTSAPIVTVDKQEDKQQVSITQATSTTGTATVVVTAADSTTRATYTLTFKVALLADNTLKDIKVNGKSVPGFTPSQSNYKVSLPVGTAAVPEIEAVSAYPEGEQTIVVTKPALENLNGGQALIKVTTPGNQNAKTYKLTFKLEASSYTYLNAIRLDGVTLSNFVPTNLTYYVRLPLGTTSLPQITYTEGDEYQQVSISEGGIDGMTRITVTAGNGDQSVYKLVFSTEKSEISTLNGITIGGVPLEGFRPEVTSYAYKLPIGSTEVPEIAAVPHDEFQTITINKGTVNGTTRITVTAGNGNTTIYLIAFSVDAYTDNTLKSIKLDGVELEGFDPEVNEYWVNLPQGTTELPEVTFEKQDEQFQTVTTRSGGIHGDYRITVRPQSGASRSYIIHFSVATSSNTALADLRVEGYSIGFDPEVTEYHVTLPEGVSTIPAVSYTKAEETQRVLSVLEDTVQIVTVTAQSGAKREYKIFFRIQLSENAFLEMIYLDGVALEDFDPQTTRYNVMLASSTCPLITVDKAPGQQVTITSPVKSGDAKILVTPEMGASNTYIITFSPVPAASVQLADIRIDGVGIAGFLPTLDHYEATFTTTHPLVEGVASDPSQKLVTMWVADTCWLHVSDTLGASASYYIAFTRTLVSRTELASITADGVEINGFAPGVKDYTFTWTSGVAYPELGYVKGDASQMVTFGQVSEGTWKFHVVAETGDATDYTVTYSVVKNSDATLENIELVTLPGGQHLDFVATQNNYGPFLLDKGADMPDIRVTAKAGQRVMSYTVSETEQRVVVVAESGATNTYIIAYTRNKSGNALLKTILVGGKKLAGFEPDEHDYTVTLPQGTTVVPNVFPVGQLDNQTITTYMCRPNDTVRIHVMAQDSTETEYTIAFPVTKSHNTKLGSLTINGEAKDVNTMNFTYDDVPFGTFEPYIVTYTKAEEGQLIHYEEAPITGVTKITVTSESGEATRTYSIRYNVAVPEGANVIKKIHYSYVDKDSNTVTDSVSTPKAGDNKVTVPYGTKSFEITGYEKNYAEQAVLLYNGGVRRGAKLVAVANREGEDDVTYNIIPEMEADTVGKLKDLTFLGTTVKNFNPDVYNYIVNVTVQPEKTDFVGTAFGGATVTNSDLDTKNKQITLTVTGGETYSVCWFYNEDEAPFTFSWEKTKDNVTFYRSNLTGKISVEGTKPSTGYRPHGWTVPADLFAGIIYEPVVSTFTYYTGKEVTRISDKELILATIRGGALNSSLPGAMTLGSLSLPDGVKIGGGTKVSFTNDLTVGLTFRNTPEEFKFDYLPIMSYGISKFNAWIALGTDDNTKITHTMTGSYSNLGEWSTMTQALSYDFTVKKLNILLCSSEISGSSITIYNGSESKSSDLQIRNVRFVYNSALTKATINGKDITPSDNVFTYTLGPNEIITAIPDMKFSGAVHDQTQTIEWLNNGEWVNGELKAKVVNYGENAHAEIPDSTIYTVVLKRAPVTSLDYTATFGGYPTTEQGDTTYINLPYGTQALPDFTIEPESPHQRFEVAKNNRKVTVKVTAENGTSKNTVYIFREMKSSDALLESFTCDSIKTVDATNFIYSVRLDKLPEIEYEKKSGLYQLVDLEYTTDSATLTVTAEDGKTRQTYTVRRLDPIVNTSGMISQFELNGTPMQELGMEADACVKARMDAKDTLLFTCQFEQDSVVFIQRPEKMEWKVFDSKNTLHTYSWTYPTTPSANTLLGAILIDGVDYSEFAASREDYTSDPIYAADSIYIQPVAAEAVQTIDVNPVYENNGVTYHITVTAENGVDKKEYKMRVDLPKSEDKTLSAILIDGEPIPNFSPAVSSYTVTLPAPAVKTAEQVMPSITYLAGHPGQKIVMENGGIGELDPTLITVTSEKGAEQVYSVTILSEPSHCADLTGIMINGKALEEFEPGRHYYSLELNTSEIDVQYASDDRFQTVEVITDGNNRTLRVTAQDGTTVSDYNVTIFVQLQSSDATLANILLEQDGQMVEFVDFQRALNSALKFEPMQHSYDINLPAGTTVLPEVSAKLKMDGQQVSITKNGMVIKITVEAIDHTLNDYTLNFAVPKSKNADLSMIFIDGDSLQGFTPGYYYYEVNLPVGVHSLPEVAGQKSESGQSVAETVYDTDKLQASITVQAEDSETRPNNYMVVFHFTRSDADSLLMVYADGDTLRYVKDNVVRTFTPGEDFYNISLPVGTMAFPELSWAEVDEWQTITLDTVVDEPNNLKRRIHVKAESGKSKTYMFDYTIEKSSADTLQMIYMDTRPLDGFSPRQDEYSVVLSAAYANELNGALPTIEYLAADTLQTVMISQAPDTLTTKSLGYKTIVSVTAPSGAMRFYTIHYLVETSSDASLNMIMLGGKPMSGFDSQKQIYRLDLDSRASLPAVTVVKKEDAQTYDISIHGDSVVIDVFAEDATQMTYTLIFTRQLSDETQLQSIRLEGHPEFLYSFVSSEYDYWVKLGYGEDTIPAITFVKADSLQYVPATFQRDTIEASGDIRITIPVTAPNGVDKEEYTITFRFAKNNDAFIKSISLRGKPMEGFNAMQNEYVYVHPFGSDTTDFFTAEDIAYVLSDELAEVNLIVNTDGVIILTVVAQDGETEQTYTIRQTIGKDNDCALKAILLDGELIPDFDPDVTFYTYYLLPGGVAPTVDAEPRSENADWTKRDAAAGDTCMIICTAADGSEKRYYIHFAYTQVDPGKTATGNDVILKRVPGAMQIFVGTIRQGVSFVLFDQNGRLLYTNRIPVADPNNTEVYKDIDNCDKLNNITDTSSGLLVDILPGRTYFYVFFADEKVKIASGKLIALP